MALKLKKGVKFSDMYGNIYDGGLYTVVTFIELNKKRRFGSFNVDMYSSEEASNTEGVQPLASRSYDITPEMWDKYVVKDGKGHYPDPFEIGYLILKDMNDSKTENGEVVELQEKKYKDWEDA
jgi:hypothetical protein